MAMSSYKERMKELRYCVGGECLKDNVHNMMKRQMSDVDLSQKCCAESWGDIAWWR